MIWKMIELKGDTEISRTPVWGTAKIILSFTLIVQTLGIAYLGRRLLFQF